ncbi:MAG: amidohydrolase family protein [Candidatus Latescibacterota bacterium]|nr:amidohydrolase family protein [Candidatus Latescibacterota bacterium]
MIIDVHAHVLLRPILAKSRSNSRPFMSAEQQIQRMEDKGIDKAVILPLNSADGPSERQSMGEVLSICERYPGRFIPYCEFDPRRHDWRRPEDFQWALEQYRDLGFKGFGELTARLEFDHPRMLALFQACERVGFPVTFHTSPREVPTYGVIDELGMPRFEKVLEQCPNLVFFGHSGSFWSEISGDLTAQTKEGYPKGPIAPGGTLPRLFREYPNLNGDISAGSGFNALTRDPQFTWEFIDEFQDRLLLGLDHTDVELDFQHIEWLTQARDDGHISDDALQKILWCNADRLISLGLADG